jgi:hypothetical protein
MNGTFMWGRSTYPPLNERHVCGKILSLYIFRVIMLHVSFTLVNFFFEHWAGLLVLCYRDLVLGGFVFSHSSREHGVIIYVIPGDEFDDPFI